MIPQPCDEFERCYCTRVTRAQVLAAIAEQGCRSVEDLQRATGACTGCRTCRPELDQLLAGQEAARRPAEG
jgi:NAD(P)H-nitrite reductase large subunit